MSQLGAGGYNPQHFAALDAVEENHFWFRARRKIVGSLVCQITATFPAGYHVLEAGCGNGSLLSTLQSACPGGRVIGMDPLLEGLRHAQRRTDRLLVQGDAEQPPFGVRFALVGLFDVLEHIPDDLAILRAIHQLLIPGGALLMTVPAHMSLWSYFDVASNHCRRYDVGELRRKLQAAGFAVEYVTQFLAALFPVMWASRRWRTLRRRARGEDASPETMVANELSASPLVNAALSTLCSAETPWHRRRLGVPMGTSLLAIARRPAPAHPH